MGKKIYNFPWHNDECVRKNEYITIAGDKHFFCETHNQWASERWVKRTIIYEYGDGSQHVEVVDHTKS